MHIILHYSLLLCSYKDTKQKYEKKKNVNVLLNNREHERRKLELILKYAIINTLNNTDAQYATNKGKRSISQGLSDFCC